MVSLKAKGLRADNISQTLANKKGKKLQKGRIRLGNISSHEGYKAWK